VFAIIFLSLITPPFVIAALVVALSAVAIPVYVGSIGTIPLFNPLVVLGSLMTRWFFAWEHWANSNGCK
jgi:hypothetical protein